MKVALSLGTSVIGLCLGFGVSSAALAQGNAQSEASDPDALVAIPPPQQFATAEEHYNYLLEQAEGGTQHTMESIPQWNGLWTSGPNTMVSLFLEDGTLAMAMRPGAPVKEGVLTPEYEAQFRERRAEIDEYGEQRYDRLTHCEYPGAVRWLWEPYVREFVNLPHQSWFMNDFMNETRRVYIDQDHINVYGTHSPTGDSIGFWDEDQLIVWTNALYPADYLRGMPLTSNQMELVEIWEEKTLSTGATRLEVQVTFYDPIALVEPLTAAYSYNPRPDMEEAGQRIRNWECSTTSNSYEDASGDTQFLLPGDPGFQDARGTTAFGDLPGQALNPIYNDSVTSRASGN